MSAANRSIDEYLKKTHQTMSRMDLSDAKRLSDYLFEAWRERRFIFVFGNGGSGATASHFCGGDLGKNALREGRPGRRHEEAASRHESYGQHQLDHGAGQRQSVTNTCSFNSWSSTPSRATSFWQSAGRGKQPRTWLRPSIWAETPRPADLRADRLRRRSDSDRSSRTALHVPIHDMGIVRKRSFDGLLHWVVDDIHARINGRVPQPV